MKSEMEKLEHMSNVLLMMLATERHEREVHTDRVQAMGDKFGATHNELERITGMLHQVPPCLRALVVL